MKEVYKTRAVEEREAEDILEENEENEKEKRIIKNIALVDVGRSGGGEKQSYKENQFNLALGYLGAMLLKEGYNLSIFQEYANKSKEEILEGLEDFSPDLIGYSSFSYQFKETLRFKKKVDSLFKDKKVKSVLGGIHASTSPENAIDNFDYLVFGEGEETFKELLQYLNKETEKEKKDIKGIFYRDEDGKMVFTGKRERIADLDKYGDPVRIYFELNNSGMVSPIPDWVTGFAPIAFSRGCVRACKFCTNKETLGAGKDARAMRKPEKIVDEIERLFNENKINYFYCHEEDYTYDDEFMGKISDILLERKKDGRIGDIHISGMGSVGSFYKDGKANKELIKKMADAGFGMVALGIERVTNKDLSSLYKGTKIEQIKEVTQELFDQGIVPVSLFIYALKGDTKEELETMVDQAIEIPAIRYRFAPAYPLKGTELRKKTAEEDWIDLEFKKDDYADAEKPVLKTAFSQSRGDEGYQYLLNFEKMALRKIYSSVEYGKRLEKFIEKTGDKFRTYLTVTWKETLRNELGEDLDFKW